LQIWGQLSQSAASLGVTLRKVAPRRAVLASSCSLIDFLYFFSSRLVSKDFSPYSDIHVQFGEA
jgi:hypothetical protein